MSSADERYKKIIQNEMNKLTKNVTLKVFTSLRKQPDGSKTRECAGCDQTMDILRIYEENSNGKLNIEELSIHDDPEFAKQYDIQRVPTILFIDDNGREIIRYLANPMRGEIQPFVKAIFAFAGGPNYYENAVKENLYRIPPSTIKVMITNQCPYCPNVVEAANLFAIASGGKIRTVVVDVLSNPDIGQYYSAEGVPYTIINEKQPIQGMIGPKELLRALIGNNIKMNY